MVSTLDTLKLVKEQETDMSTEQQSVQVRRQVIVRTLVNDGFRQRAHSELTEEQKIIDAQLQQLEAQYQHTVKQLEDFAGQGKNVQRELEQVNRDYQKKRSDLSAAKIQVSSQAANLDKIENGQFLVTGQLEELVTVNVGDNLYEKLQTAEMIVEDGIVKSIQPVSR